MDAQLRIDSLEFARAAQRLHANIPLLRLPRLQSDVSAAPAGLDFELTGMPALPHAQAAGRPGLRLEVRGQLVLNCQRCLEPLAFDLNVTSLYALVEDAREAQRLDDLELPFDFLAADPQLDVHQLVEDEILLALPYAPAHSSTECGPAECGVAPPADTGGSTHQPFAELAARLQRGKR